VNFNELRNCTQQATVIIQCSFHPQRNFRNRDSIQATYITITIAPTRESTVTVNAFNCTKGWRKSNKRTSGRKIMAQLQQFAETIL